MNALLSIKGILGLAALILFVAAALDGGTSPRFNRLLASGLACLSAGIML